MKWTSLNDLREKYLSFFESKGHLRLPSFPLIPQGDKSLLLINSGMAPMKKFFTGEVEPPRRRVTTCQKCIRTPDIDRVGITARHGTYFEMLGNFSFGDYFKREAIHWSWEFLTVTLEIPADLLYPSVYEHDDEAYAIWRDEIGVPESHIKKLGKADNFWEHGTGPCGPCSEIYFDRGLKYGCGSPDCGPGCDCDRFMEIWNNVFSQFNSDGAGNYTELEQKNIDTGMGLERLACVMQDVDNMFEVDSVRRILDHVVSISGKEYGADTKNDISIRVITDHIRSATFMICDGVTPSNEGRGYVLRRILRRAARHGKLLGITHEFLCDLCNTVIEENVAGYPELEDKADYIKKIISIEEERFNATIDAGLSILSDMIRGALSDSADTISGEEAFKLYDTFGFPLDLTREIAQESGLKIDEDTFTALMQQQRARARAARANISGWSEAASTALEGLRKTEFTGYTDMRSDAEVIAILVDGELADTVSEGDCTVILDRTPFYGEGGGQVGDTGTIYKDGTLISVTDTKKTDGVYLHLCTVAAGVLSVGDKVTADISDTKRTAIMRNHSACHLLQAALRRVLGNHVEQAGSYVDEHRVRFDFSHYEAVTAEQLAAVEALVNANILVDNEIKTVETDIETARSMGAMALFGEKYGDVVRVVKMGEFSCELCGGTHAGSTGQLGLFKITSESSVAAGVRRIEGTTGTGVLELMAEKDELIAKTARELKANNPADIASRAAHLTAELSDAKREIERLNSSLAAAKADSIAPGALEVGSVRLICADMGAVTMDIARSLADKLKAENASNVIVLAINNGGKINFLASCGADAVKAGAHAGNLLREVSAITGGKGGGRPDSATSGGRDADKIADALAAAEGILKGMLK
ncbi:MAG: alanine--tRNA ligase [Clostridia bacterium]|nr:alanine--tRNA ligase [Clostridia bacterium]